MSHTISAPLLRIFAIACITMTLISPVYAFKANSLDITIHKNGDATAIFKFTLEGLLENAIPQSMLEEELKKGLTTSSDPPQLISTDRSGVTMLLTKFADTQDVETGTEYLTSSMNFQKAEIALKNSAVSSVVSADFSPDKIRVVFPDAYFKNFENSAVLPALTHIVIDPSKPVVKVTPARTGTINVTSSPEILLVSIDGNYAGDSPGSFPDLTPGLHTLQFQKDGFASVTKTVTVVEGRTTKVFVSLQYLVTPTKASSGLLPVPGFGVVLAGLAIGSCILVRRLIR